VLQPPPLPHKKAALRDFPYCIAFHSASAVLKPSQVSFTYRALYSQVLHLS
jgi:hypothetical protein